MSADCRTQSPLLESREPCDFGVSSYGVYIKSISDRFVSCHHTGYYFRDFFLAPTVHAGCWERSAERNVRGLSNPEPFARES